MARPRPGGDRNAPHNLPAEVSSFVGRERQLRELRQLLSRARVITLTGAGGVVHGCPRMIILATSREPLAIEGEHLCRVPSLCVPPANADADRLLAWDATRLFVDRARQHRSDFAVDVRNASAVGSLCRRLDGIPLAIELAAARLRTLPLDEINNRLDQRFFLLTGGHRTTLPRHQTLQALIDWSYELLNPRRTGDA